MNKTRLSRYVHEVYGETIKEIKSFPVLSTGENGILIAYFVKTSTGRKIVVGDNDDGYGTYGELTITELKQKVSEYERALKLTEEVLSDWQKK